MNSLTDLSAAIEQTETLLCTVVTRSHLKYAWALRQGLRRYHPDIPFCVLVADALAGDELPEEEHFDCPLIRLDSFITPKIVDMTIFYTAYEFCGNIKPYFLLHLFEKTPARKIIYLDSDLFITGPLWSAFGILDTCDATGVPHTLSPIPNDGSEPSDLTIAANGVYNTGFMGFARTSETRSMLAWLADRVYRLGFNAFSRGMFCEQRFFNLGINFLRDRFRPILLEGYNVAYWNLHERTVEKRNSIYFSNGHRVTFFHMSGFDLEAPEQLSKYDQRYTLATHPQAEVMRCLCADYHELFRVVPFTSHQGYRFDVHNGVSLTPAARKHYHDHGTFDGLISLDEALALADRHMNASEHGEAAQLYGLIVRQMPEHIGALVGYGLANERMGNHDQARRAFLQVLALDAGHQEAKHQLQLS